MGALAGHAQRFGRRTIRLPAGDKISGATVERENAVTQGLLVMIQQIKAVAMGGGPDRNDVLRPTPRLRDGLADRSRRGAPELDHVTLHEMGPGHMLGNAPPGCGKRLPLLIEKHRF